MKVIIGLNRDSDNTYAGEIEISEIDDADIFLLYLVKPRQIVEACLLAVDYTKRLPAIIPKGTLMIKKDGKIIPAKKEQGEYKLLGEK